MLLNGTNPLLQAFDAFLNLAVGELDEGAGFSELLVQIDSIIGMTPVEMHLKPFGDKLELMPESFGQNAGVTFGVDYFDPKGFGSSVNDLLNFRQRFLVHAVSP
jgi:hypothetical protein